MNVYILFAHPSPDAYSRRVLEEFVRGLGDAGHTWVIGDLYAMGFQSEMDGAQYRREVGPDPEAPVPDDVRAEQAKVEWADALTFIYPLWWSDCPAKLKGWFDRVWTMGYAYFYDSSGDRHTRIQIRKALVITSAGHPVDLLEETGVAESMRRIMLQDRLLGVGVEQAELVILGGIMPGDESCRRSGLETAYRLGATF
jgi:NAD(P)H dehydrogenase (quinone)